MARKKPSSHSDQQFALFVEKIKGMVDVGQHGQFEETVRNLILRGGKNSPGGDGPTRPGLPPRPDFAAIETIKSSTNLLALIGQLVFSWSNNESLLIYVLMLLLETDEPSAAIVFSTLNTTRARLDLMRRLTAIKVREPHAKRELERLLSAFDEANHMRSEIMHAMYAVNENGGITHGQATRIVSKKGRVTLGNRRPIDRARIDAVAQACRNLQRLNRVLWDLLPHLKEAIGSTSTGRERQAAADR